MSTPPSDRALWHTSVKLQHSAQALLSETQSVGRVSFLRRERAIDPVQTLVKSVFHNGTSGLTEPLHVLQTVQAQLLGSFGCRHCIEQFLLHGKKPTQPYRASRPRSIAAVDANQTVCFLVVLASHEPDLVLTFHVPHAEIRSLVPNVSTLILVIKIAATNSSSFQLYRIVVSLAASSPTAHIPISVLPTTHSHTCARLSCLIWRLRASPFRRCWRHPSRARRVHKPPSTMACDVVLVWPPSHRQRLCHQSTVSRLPAKFTNPIQTSPRCFRSFRSCCRYRCCFLWCTAATVLLILLCCLPRCTSFAELLLH